MKKLIIFLLVLSTISTYAQSPLAFNFQGIARDMSGNPLPDKTIGLEFALIQGTPQGPIVYLESHELTTNSNALFSVAIGRGLVRFGEIAEIDWADGPYFMRTALDETGGQNFTVVGTSELLSVPFALHALNSGESIWQLDEQDITYLDGNVGIGTDAPKDKLHINAGNIYIEQINDGIIMRSPNGICWKQTVSNTGQSQWASIPCPETNGNPTPSIYTNPSQLEFSLNSTRKSFLIQNNGNVSYNWSLTYPSAVMSISPSTGNLQPTQSRQLTVTLDRTNMPSDINEYEIVINTDAGVSKNITVIVNNVQPLRPPVVSIILPNQPAQFSSGESITFSADISDPDSPNQDIEVTWKSNLDGELFTGTIDASGNSSFTTSELSRGTHSITVTAVDADGLSGSRSIQVSTLSPGPITLLEPSKAEGNVTLNWTEYSNSDFVKYEIFRSNGNCTDNDKTFLTSITDQETTSFIDELAPLEYQVCYFIVVTNDANLTRKSNEVTVDLPSGHIFNFVPHDMLIHPTDNYVYLIDQGGQRLVKYDFTTQEVVSETGLQGTIGWCAIGDNGFGIEIYTPSSDGWIYVYSADDLSQTTAINAGLRITSVAINGLGHVIAAVNPSPWWEQPVRTYRRDNGLHLDGDGGFEGDRLRLIPGKNELISISTGVSPTDMEYFKLTDEGLIEIHQDDQYHGDYPLDARIFKVSSDGTYSVTSRNGAVYLANSSMEYKGQIQRGSLNFSDFTFSDDGSVIYAGTSNRRSIQIAEYPSLIRNEEILTKGYPVYIERSGNSIISLSKQNENSINSAIEVIRL